MACHWGTFFFIIFVPTSPFLFWFCHSCEGRRPKEMPSGESTNFLLFKFTVCSEILLVALSFNFILLPFLFFLGKKRKRKTDSSRASGSVATDYPHSTLFLAKNDKLPTVKQCRFLYAKKSIPFGLADAREEEQAVTHWLMWKHPLSSLFEYTRNTNYWSRSNIK